MKAIRSNSHLDLNKQIYKCCVCEKLFNWNDNSYWYGSEKQLENKPKSILYICSRVCKNKHKLD